MMEIVLTENEIAEIADAEISRAEISKESPLMLQCEQGSQECIIIDTATGQCVTVHNQREAEWLCACLSQSYQNQST